MLRIARLSLVLLCATAAAGLPGVALAADDRQRPQPPRASLFFLEGSDGYEGALITYGNQVMLELAHFDVGAAYAVPGRVSDKRIDARFGRLGQVSGHYERVDLFGRKDGSKGSRCEDPVSFVSFEGRISFRGEGGYTAVEERRLGGLLFDPAARRCRQRAGASAAPRLRPLNTLLTAISKRNEVVTSFALWRRAGQRRVTVEASRQERRGAMRILRWASTIVGGENAFAFSGPGVRPPLAFVAAPKPFSGSALFQAGLGAASWTGSLSAWLPGAGKVGLTGPGYALGFCRRAADEPGCNPLSPVARQLGPAGTSGSAAIAQGNGSQSQALGEARLSWSRYRLNSASSAGSTP